MKNLLASSHCPSCSQVFQGIMERDKEEALLLMGQAGSTLDVLLENMGRISFGYNASDFKVG